jgi:hypothetical protein
MDGMSLPDHTLAGLLYTGDQRAGPLRASGRLTEWCWRKRWLRPLPESCWPDAPDGWVI